MKSNYDAHVNRSELRRKIGAEAEKLMRKYEATIRAEIEDSVARQMMAVVFTALHREFGWGAARLQRLKNATEDEFVLIRCAPLGRKYTALDLEQALKEQFGVDFTTTRYTAEGWTAVPTDGKGGKP